MASTTPKLVTFTSSPFGATFNQDIQVDIESGRIVVTVPPLFRATLLQEPRGVTADYQGGWLPEHHAQEAKRRKKWKKIQEKRERRQEYVMRKIWAELQGIDFEDDPELMALMAEFETPEEIFQSAEEIKQQLNDAYMKYVVEKQIRIGKQDQEDEEAVMLSLMSML